MNDFLSRWGIGILIALLLVSLIVGMLIFANWLGNRVFSEVFDRPQPKPTLDRSPTEINQETIYGRGQNWFYARRLDFYDLTLRSFDNLKLKGYYLPAQNPHSNKLVILVHGWSDNPSVMAAFAQLYLEQGDCHILIPHLRAHGMSDGQQIGFGLADSQDLLMWTAYVEKNLPSPLSIIYHGWSMGAVTALLAAGSRHASSQLKGVVADSPYDTLENELAFQFKKRQPWSAKTLLWLLDRKARKKLGYGLNRISALAVAPNIEVPVLFFHGQKDSFVPLEMSEHLYDKIRAPKRLVEIEDADHVEGYNLAPSVYTKEIQSFLRICRY